MNFFTETFDIANSDITLGLTSVLEVILNGVKFCFEFLQSIEFFGTNLLSFSLTLLILAAVFPIIFSLVSSRVVYTSNRFESNKLAKARAQARAAEKQAAQDRARAMYRG